MRHSRQALVTGLLAAAFAGGVACSSQRLVAVDPPDAGGALGGGPGSGGNGGAAGNPVTPDGSSADLRDAGAGGGGDTGVVAPGLLDGIVGYWRLDDGVGSASARDGSGHSNNGALVQLNTGTAWVPGHAATGLGVYATGWVVVTPSPSVDGIAQQVTISGWVYLDGALMSYGTLLSREIGATIEQHYHLSLNADRRPTLFVTTANKTVIVTSPDQATPRTWIHIAGTYDGREARLYVNGVSMAAMPITGAFTPDTTPVIVGGNVNDATGVPTELFPGRIDEVMLYSRALTADEMVRIYNDELVTRSTTDRDAGID